MGFIQAVRALGALEQGQGLDPYLSFPLEKGGKMIRVALRVVDPDADSLDVQGVDWVDLADQEMTQEKKRRYLYRNRVGSNVSWAFTPVHKMGKPKKDAALSRTQILGNDGDWAGDSKSHLNKIYNKLLLDYEKTETFSPGSVERIMADLPGHLELVLPDLDSKASYIFIFGIGDGERFVYPGDIPAFVNYFRTKLSSSLQTVETGEGSHCAICGCVCQPIVLSKAFKFATADKVNVLHGLQEREEQAAFPVCQQCFEAVSAGRDHLQLKLNYNSVLPRINIWILPEAVGGNGGMLLKKLMASLEEHVHDQDLKGPGERREEQYFQRLAHEGRGLVFHFVFWERNNAQELVHLMVEDVPPERLAVLELQWRKAWETVFGRTDHLDRLSVDWAIKSLYKTLSIFAGKSESDKLVFRDFTLKVIGKMLRGERMPVDALKQAVVKRVERLVYQTNTWQDVGREVLYAQTWVEYMILLNEEAMARGTEDLRWLP
jgi:CRISPR-associated protein Csh1